MKRSVIYFTPYFWQLVQRIFTRTTLSIVLGLGLFVLFFALKAECKLNTISIQFEDRTLKCVSGVLKIPGKPKETMKEYFASLDKVKS